MEWERRSGKICNNNNNKISYFICDFARFHKQLHFQLQQNESTSDINKSIQLLFFILLLFFSHSKINYSHLTSDACNTYIFLRTKGYANKRWNFYYFKTLLLQLSSWLFSLYLHLRYKKQVWCVTRNDDRHEIDRVCVSCIIISMRLLDDNNF